MREVLNRYTKSIINYIKAFILWILLGLLVGIVSGLLGSTFSKSISFVTELRVNNSIFIYFLPLAGLLSVFIYKICRVTDIGTNQVLQSVRSESTVPYLLAPAVFIGTCLTHFSGGSAGREGAALQLGGSIASLLGRLFRLDDRTKHILTMCGMGAFFSALFGTPLGACIFALEVVSVGHFCSAAFFPAMLSSVTAFGIATYFGVHPERFIIKNEQVLEFSVLLKVAVIAVICAFVSFAFCHLMHFSERFFKKTIKNEYLRILFGGLLLVGLTFLVGSYDYNGGGVHVINRIFESGEFRYEAFILKIIFTAITIGVGFKGGEIIPTLFIGATLGAAIGSLLGLDVGLSAAVGMASLFCGVTNCPLATIVLCIELFNGCGMIYCAVACVISFLLSGNTSLYTAQKIVYSKLNDEEINVNVG